MPTIVRDRRVTTWASKIGKIDKSSLDALIVGEPGYWIVCMTPASRWLLLSLLTFIDEYKNRWLSFEDNREIDQLVAETNWGMICPVGCSEDLANINTTLQGISLTLIEMRDRLGDENGDLDTRLTEIKTEIAELETSVTDWDLADIFDQIEPILSGVGVILGAPPIP